jgi:SAM-dependent methyltransferase
LAWFAAFAFLAGVFWRTDVSRVSLYLSKRATADALARLLPAGPWRVVDLGCGHGGLLLRLATARPDAWFTGVAPERSVKVGDRRGTRLIVCRMRAAGR